MAMKIKKEDNVLILSGKEAGKTGKVMACMPKEGRVMVEGINMVTKHSKPRRQGEMGGRVETEAPINASNVLPICPKCNKATRVAYKVDGDTKTRVCKKCGADLNK